MVELGLVQENLVPLTPKTAAAFRTRWCSLVPPNTWQEKLALPFRHLTFEGFWTLVKDNENIKPSSLGNSVSLSQLSELNGARFSPDLWALIQERLARQALRSVLLNTYFSDQSADEQTTSPVKLLSQEAERLLSQAQAKFRAKKPRPIQDEDGVYVRHALFPRVIVKLYEQSCAVCHLRVQDDRNRQLVDAAHILPFALFHNDDPRNGLALCKNHHWAFDRGWFAVTDQHCLLVSPRAEGADTFIGADAPLALPKQTEYAPAVEALRWHRENILLR